MQHWKDYCYDLIRIVNLYKDVKSDDFVLKDGDAVQGIAYVIETYGLIYNKAILNDYCTMDRRSNYLPWMRSTTSHTLKAVADDIQARKSMRLMISIWL